MFSLQFLPADVRKASESQQGETFLLLWIAIRPDDDFSQCEGHYGCVLEERK